MAKIQLPIYYQDGSDERKLRCVVDAWTFQDNAMGERYITFNISSYQPIFFAIGDYCIYRGETYTLNYRPSETQSAKIGEHGEAFTYEKVKFESFGEELTRCTMLDITPTTGDYIAYEGTNYTGSAVFSLFCGEATVTLQGRTFTMTAVSVLAGKIQANLDRMFPRAGWRVLVDYEHTHTDDFLLTLDNWTVAQALSEVYNTFKLNYIVKGREIRIGFAADNVTGEELFAFGFGRGYPTTEHDGKGLFEIKKTSDSNQKIVTRLRALGSTKNMPYRYYNKKYNLPQAMFPLNLQLPDTFETPEVKAAHNAQREESLRDVLGDTNDAYIDKNDNAAECAEGIREDVARWDGSDGNLKEIFPTIKEGTYSDLRNANVPDYGGRTGSSSYPNYNPTERVDEVLAVGYSNGGIWIDDVNTGDGILPETIADGKEKKIQSAQIPLTAVQSSSLISEGDYLLGPETSLCTIKNQQPGAYILVSNHLFFYAYYNAGGTIFSSSAIDAGYRLSIKISGKQPLVFNKTEEITHLGTFFKEQLQRIPDVEKGQDAQIEKIVLDSVSDVEVTIRPIFKTLPSTAGTYTVSFQLRDDEGKNDDPYFVWSPDETNWGTVGQQFHLYIKDIGFDINDYWGGDTPKLVMASGVCVSKAFEISEVKPVTYSRGGQTLECYCLTLNRDSDDSLHAYFPSENYPIHVSDQFVLEGIEMPDVYVELAELRLLRAATDYLADNCETNFIYKPSLNDIYLQWNYDKMVAAGTREKSIYWRLYAGLKFTFRGIPESTDPSAALPIAEITIESVTIREGVATTPQVEITLNKNIQQNTIQKLTTAVDRIYSTMSNGTGGTGAGASNAMLLSLLKSEGAKLFLSKKEADAAQGFIQFLQGMGVGSSGMGISRDGAARLLSVVLNGGYGIDAGGKATLADVVARLITATGLVSPDYGGDDLVGGSGFKMEYDALTGRSSVFTDFLTVRMKAIFAALEIRKVTYSSGTLVVSGAGSEAYKVAPVGADGSRLDVIPAQYRALSHIEKNTYYGYLDTGYRAGSATKIVLDLTIPTDMESASDTYPRVLLSGRGSANTSFDVMLPEMNQVRFAYRGTQNIGAMIERGVRTRIVIDGGVMTYTDEDGNLVTLDSGVTTTWTSGVSLILWAYRNGATVNQRSANRSIFMLHRMEIYEDGVLVRDYLPSCRTSDDVLGFFDLANSTFDTGTGLSELVAGTTIHAEGTEDNPFFNDTPREYEDSDVYAHRIYCVADDGTTATMNDWHVGDQVLCQTFNIDDASLVHTDLSNRYWWRLALRTGTEVLDDGKQYTWVEVASDKHLQLTAAKRTEAIYNDLFSEAEAGQVFEAYATLFPRYDGGGEGDATACDVPEEGDTMAQVGSQTEDRRMGLAMVRADGVDSGFYIYAGVNSFTLSGRLVTKITPRGTVMSSQFFRIVSSADVGNPKPLTVFRGEWSASEAYAYYDEVTYGGERWACVNAAGVAAGGNPPSRTNSDWLLTVAKGNDGEAGVGLGENLIDNSEPVCIFYPSEMEESQLGGNMVRYGTTDKTYVPSHIPADGTVMSGRVRITLTNCQFKGDAAVLVYLQAKNQGAGTAWPSIVHIPVNSGTNVYEATNEGFTIDSNGGEWDGNLYIRLDNFTSQGSVKIERVKLEVGDKCSAWSLSENDKKGTDGKDGQKGDKGDNGDKGDKGDKGDDGADGNAFTLSPSEFVVTQRYGENVSGWDVANNSVVASGFYRSGNNASEAAAMAIQSVAPSTAAGVLNVSQTQTNKLLIDTTALGNIGNDINYITATIRLSKGSLYQDLAFNLYINRLGTLYSQTIGDATETIRQRSGWKYNPTTREWEELALVSYVEESAEGFSRQISALPISRNLLLNTDFHTLAEVGNRNCIHLIPTKRWQGYRQVNQNSSFTLSAGTTYLLNFYAYGKGTVGVVVQFFNPATGAIIGDSSGSWSLYAVPTRYELAITPSATCSFIVNLGTHSNDSDIGKAEIYLSRPQLKAGNAIDWTDTFGSNNRLRNSSFEGVGADGTPQYWDVWDNTENNPIILPSLREIVPDRVQDATTKGIPNLWTEWNDNAAQGYTFAKTIVKDGSFDAVRMSNFQNQFQGIRQFSSVRSNGFFEKVLKHGGKYSLSFWAKGNNRVDVIVHFLKVNDDGTVGAVVGQAGYSYTFKQANTWEYVTFDEPIVAVNNSQHTPDDGGYGFCVMIGCTHGEGVAGSEQIYVARPQLEEGDTATEWHRGEENSEIMSSRFEQTAERIDMAVYKDEAEVVGMHMDGANSHLDFVANKTGFFGTDGKEYIKWGVKDGIPYLIFLDGDGNERYNLGYTGLIEIIQNTRPQSWTTLNYIGSDSHHASFSDGDTIQASELKSITGDACFQYNEAYTLDGQGIPIYSPSGGYRPFYNGNVYRNNTMDASAVPTGQLITAGWRFEVVKRTSETTAGGTTTVTVLYDLFYIGTGTSGGHSYTIKTHVRKVRGEYITTGSMTEDYLYYEDESGLRSDTLVLPTRT